MSSNSENEATLTLKVKRLQRCHILDVDNLFINILLEIGHNGRLNSFLNITFI